jgi:hypothetical protein
VAAQVERDRPHAPAVLPQAPPPPTAAAPSALQQAQAQLQQAFQPPPQQQGTPPTFGQAMATYALLGFGMSLAFAVALNPAARQLLTILQYPGQHKR